MRIRYRGLQIIPVMIPNITPPRISPGQPSAIYPGRAFTAAQAKEGIIPTMVAMITSSKKRRVGLGPEGKDFHHPSNPEMDGPGEQIEHTPLIHQMEQDELLNHQNSSSDE